MRKPSTTVLVSSRTISPRTRHLAWERARKALNAAFETPLDEGLAYENALGKQLDDTHDYTEGFTARLEDREPEFEGR